MFTKKLFTQVEIFVNTSHALSISCMKPYDFVGLLFKKKKLFMGDGV